MVRRLRGISCPALVLCFLAFSGGENSASATNWWENATLKGDFRYRHEMIDKEGQSARHRQRIRARLSVAGDVAPGIGVVIQLATGSSDPISTNQTLGDAGSTKSVGLDLAYAKASHKKLPGFTLMAGKMKNPLHKPGGTQLIWDSDWNPEGGALQISHSVNNISFQANGGGFWIEERPTTDDAWLAAVQGLAKAKLNDGESTVAVGGSYFDFVNAHGFPPFYNSSDPMGNSVVEFQSDGQTFRYYANKFQLVEGFAEGTHQVSEVPVSLFGDFVVNTSADSLNVGWLVGFTAGKLKEPGSWNARYSYRRVEKDAVVGAFTDSDFGGGGTDAKGHEFGAGVVVTQNTIIQVTYFLNKVGLQGSSSNYSRMQADAVLKF